MLFSPHLILRRAVMACLRQLVQREAAEVSEHALSLASAVSPDRPLSLATSAAGGGNVTTGVQRRGGITDTGLEGALFGLLDRDTDRQLCCNVQDTLVSLLQALAANNLTRWIMLIKDVLQASSGIQLVALYLPPFQWPVPPQFSSLASSGRELLGMSYTCCFYRPDVLLVTKPAVSKH